MWHSLTYVKQAKISACEQFGGGEARLTRITRAFNTKTTIFSSNGFFLEMGVVRKKLLTCFVLIRALTVIARRPKPFFYLNFVPDTHNCSKTPRQKHRGAMAGK